MFFITEQTGKTSIFNVCNIYIFIWLLYIFHWNDVGMFVPLLDAMSSIFLSVNLLVSLYCCYLVLNRYPINPFFTTINLLIVLFVLYGTFSVLENSVIVNAANGVVVNTGSFMIGALRTFVPIYAFFIFTELGYISEKTIRIWFWIFLVQSIIINLMMKFSFEADDLRTNNTGYLFVSLFPLIYFFRRHTLLQFLIISVFLFFVISSVKRGAILCLSIGVFYFLWNKLTTVSVSHKIVILFVCLLFFIVGSVFVENLYESSEVFKHRYEQTLEGKTSGRDEIVINLINIYLDSNPIHHIFGMGADATLQYGNWAHNDWVEILFNQGLLGIACYAIFWVNWFRVWRIQKKKKKEISLLIGLIFVCGFPRSTFAMWYAMANLYITLPLGYALSHIYGIKKFEDKLIKVY